MNFKFLVPHCLVYWTLQPIPGKTDLIIHRILKDVLRDSAEMRDGEIAIGVSGRQPSRDESDTPETGSSKSSPWSKRRDHATHQQSLKPLRGPIPIEELHDIAEESSQSERRADEAERELMEWKKAKFMEDRVGEDFDALIISVTKFGFFVELTDLFVEGLVPLATLTDDRYVYHENTREIIGQTRELGRSVNSQSTVTSCVACHVPSH